MIIFGSRKPEEEESEDGDYHSSIYSSNTPTQGLLKICIQVYIKTSILALTVVKLNSFIDQTGTCPLVLVK